MEIKTVTVGVLDTNAYILYKDGEALIIDSGDETEKILSAVGSAKICGIVVTHHHFDHDGAVNDIVKKTGVSVFDIHNLKEGKNKIGKFVFEVIYTPGHKEDSISLLFFEDGVLFSGDFIFKGTIGRWDLEGGSIRDMVKSIAKILDYPSFLKVFPGHGESTVLGDEKENLEKYSNYF